MINNAEKIESKVKKEIEKDKKKGGFGAKVRLACCGFILLLILIFGVTIAFLWFGGHIQKATCNVVEEDSQIWSQLSCSTREKAVVEQGEGEYKYNVLENGEVTVSDIEVVVSQVVEESAPAVVAIAYKGDEFSGDQVIGSGFIVTENGLIVTNQHVVSDRRQDYIIVLSGEREPVQVTDIFRDEVNDVAILRIDREDLPTVPLGDSDLLKVGQTTIAIGNPLGSFEGTVTTGIVSGLNRDVEVGSGFFNTNLSTFEGVIQTDAAINPGNSGGPLLNSNGEVIGVNFATIQGADGLSFALPINRIKARIDELNEFGNFRIPFLGVEYRQRVVFFENEAIVGAVVGNVVADSPADEAGLQEADVIIEFNGQELENDNLASIIQKSKVGEEIDMVIIREGERQEFTVTLGDRSDFE